MNCVINSSITDNLKKGKKIDVIRRYIQMKYGINIDALALQERIKSMNIKLDY